MAASGLTQRRPGDLPAEVSGFVGRRDELARLARQLRSARLVTVTGPIIAYILGVLILIGAFLLSRRRKTA